MLDNNNYSVKHFISPKLQTTEFIVKMHWVWVYGIQSLKYSTLYIVARVAGKIFINLSHFLERKSLWWKNNSIMSDSPDKSIMLKLMMATFSPSFVLHQSTQPISCSIHPSTPSVKSISVSVRATLI